MFFLSKTLEKIHISRDSVRICASTFLVNDELAVLHETRASLVDFMNMNVALGIDNTKYYLILGCSYKGCLLINIIIELITGKQQDCQLLLSLTQREVSKNLISGKVK